MSHGPIELESRHVLPLIRYIKGKIAVALAHPSKFNEGMERGYVCSLRAIVLNRSAKSCILYLNSILKLKCSHGEKACCFCEGAKTSINDTINELLMIVVEEIK